MLNSILSKSLLLACILTLGLVAGCVSLPQCEDDDSDYYNDYDYLIEDR